MVGFRLLSPQKLQGVGAPEFGKVYFPCFSSLVLLKLYRIYYFLPIRSRQQNVTNIVGRSEEQ